MNLTKRIEALGKIGVPVTPDHEYRGTQAERERVLLEGTVEGVFLQCSTDEWCRMCMRENPDVLGGDAGSLYLGGCCGNMGLCQDTMNQCFREGGYLSADDLQTIGPLLRDHDGFERFAEFDPDEFLYASEFNKLDPWERVCVIHASLEEALKLPRDERPAADSDVREGYENGKPGRFAITKLYNTLARIEWADLFDRSDPLPSQPSHQLQRRLALAKLVEPTRQLQDVLEAEQGTDPFNGYALVKPGTDELLTNRSGECIYDTEESAQYVVDLWSRWETEESVRAKHGEGVHEPQFVKPDCEIVAVSISAYGGIEVIR